MAKNSASFREAAPANNPHRSPHPWGGAVPTFPPTLVSPAAGDADIADEWDRGRSEMDERRGSPDVRREARRYEIRLKGRLDSSWAGWLGGMSLTHAADGTTVLAGPVADQAALHGLLQKLRDMGVTLISVNETEAHVPIAPADPGT